MERIRKAIPIKRNYSSVRPSILFYIAWRNLTNKKLRSLLTIFGVVIGIGAIYFLLSFGLGLQNLVTDQVIGDQSIKSIDITSPNSRIIKLDDKTVNTIKTYPHIEKVGTEYSFSGSLKRSGAEIDSVVYGVDMNYQNMTTLNKVAGRLLKDDDFRHVVINLSALESLGIKDRNKALNQVLDITIPLQGADAKVSQIKNTYTIVGVIDSGSGGEIFIPGSNFSVAGVTHYKDVKAIADDTVNIPTIRKQVETLGLQTESPIDTLDQINEIFKFFTFILIGFGSIGMIVSVLGMFNTMTISLLERTREIGLMMALGGRNNDMRKLFIFEAVLVSFLGAVVGILIAMGFGQILNLVMNNFAHRRGVTESFQLFANPAWGIAALIATTVMIGLVVVYIPARRAKRINPIEALRRE